MKKIISILLFIALLPLLMGCGLLERVPDKHFTDIGYSQEQGDMLDIDGVIYRTQPMTQWRPIDNFDATLIGTVEGTKYYVYTFDEDEKKVFALKREPGLETSEYYYYRSDVDLPEFNIKNIDFNGFDSIEFEDYGEFSHTTYDREVIDTYLANIMSGDQIYWKDYSGRRAGTGYDLELMSTEYPGIGISQGVYVFRGKFWVSFKGSALIEMPHDVLEKIAGRQLPTASEIEEQREEE